MVTEGFFISPEEQNRDKSRLRFQAQHTHTGGRSKRIGYQVFPLFTERALCGTAKELRNTKANQHAGLEPIEIHFKAKCLLMC